MLRRAAAGLLLVGLAVGVWMLWPRGDPGGQADVTLLEVAPTTTTTSLVTTTTAVTTTSLDDHVVKTVEEAEAILRELWFGWFEGIYNQDEDRIREVVATEAFLDNARAAFGTMGFAKEPEPSDIIISELEILRSDEECLVLWSFVDASSLLGDDGAKQGVDVLRRVDDSWRMATAWVYKEDLWAQDCESILEPPS